MDLPCVADMESMVPWRSVWARVASLSNAVQCIVDRESRGGGAMRKRSAS